MKAKAWIHQRIKYNWISVVEQTISPINKISFQQLNRSEIMQYDYELIRYLVIWLQMTEIA